MSSCANLNLVPTPEMVSGGSGLDSIAYLMAGDLLVGNSGEFFLANDAQNLAYA